MYHSTREGFVNCVSVFTKSIQNTALLKEKQLVTLRFEGKVVLDVKRAIGVVSKNEVGALKMVLNMWSCMFTAAFNAA